MFALLFRISVVLLFHLRAPNNIFRSLVTLVLDNCGVCGLLPSLASLSKISDVSLGMHVRSLSKHSSSII